MFQFQSLSYILEPLVAFIPNQFIPDDAKELLVSVANETFELVDELSTEKYKSLSKKKKTRVVIKAVEDFLDGAFDSLPVWQNQTEERRDKLTEGLIEWVEFITELVHKKPVISDGWKVTKLPNVKSRGKLHRNTVIERLLKEE